MQTILPPWLQAADPATHELQGYHIGSQMGAQEAAQRHQDQAMAIQMQQFQQQQALEVARQKMEQDKYEVAAREAARRSQAVLDYQKAIASGTDPLQAILQYGPAMGHQGTAEAASIRSQRMKQAPTWVDGDSDSGEPGHWETEGNIVQVSGLGRADKQAVWVPANQETGEPEHWQEPNGTIRLKAKESPDISPALRGQMVKALSDKRKAIIEQYPNLLVKHARNAALLTEDEKNALQMMKDLEAKSDGLLGLGKGTATGTSAPGSSRRLPFLPPGATQAMLPPGGEDPDAGGGLRFTRNANGMLVPSGQTAAHAAAPAPMPQLEAPSFTPPPVPDEGMGAPPGASPYQVQPDSYNLAPQQPQVPQPPVPVPPRQPMGGPSTFGAMGGIPGNSPNPMAAPVPPPQPTVPSSGSMYNSLGGVPGVSVPRGTGSSPFHRFVTETLGIGGPMVAPGRQVDPFWSQTVAPRVQKLKQDLADIWRSSPDYIDEEGVGP